MIKAVDILTYTDQFKNPETGEYNSTIYVNDSILHASIITAELFQKARKELSRTVNMYCGEFSLFRDEAQRRIKNFKMDCDTTDLSEKQELQWQAFDPYSNLQQQITLFLNDDNKGKLNLIIERGLESLKKCSIWKTLKSGMDNNRVKISVLSNPIGIGHFAVTEEAYRLEDSDDNKTASGCFRDTENANILNDNFDFLQKISEPVCL